MSIDVQSLANQSFRAKKGGVDLEVFAALVLEDAAKACEHVHKAETFMREGEFWAGMCAIHVRALKPVQS